MAHVTRYELHQRTAGGFAAKRVLVDAEPLPCAVRLETDASTSKGLLLVLVGELLRAVARDGGAKKDMAHNGR
jgi:hypothetical protein